MAVIFRPHSCFSTFASFSCTHNTVTLNACYFSSAAYCSPCGKAFKTILLQVCRVVNLVMLKQVV